MHESINFNDCLLYIGALNKLGELKQARDFLIQLQDTPHNTIKILTELRKVYNNLSDFESAINVCEKMIEIEPDNSIHYFNLARVLSFKNRRKQAETATITGLEKRNKMTMADLTKLLQQKAFGTNDHVHTTYTFVTGRNNVGAFIHDFNGVKYFTKACRYTPTAKREQLFYENILKRYPHLQNEVPKFHHSFVLNNILYLTIEYIEEDKKEKVFLNDVININKTISSIDYTDLLVYFPNRTYNFDLTGRSYAASIFFTQIHLREKNEDLLNKSTIYVKKNFRHKEYIEVFNSLKTLIIDNKLYEYIIPEHHYSLQQGDMDPSNIMFDNQSKSVKVIDWALFFIAPRFIDIARFTTKQLTAFQKIKEDFLEKANLEQIERIFFIYALIIFYIFDGRNASYEKVMKVCIEPALEELQSLVKQFNPERTLEQQLLEKMRAENKTLQAMINKQENELNAYTKKLKNIKNKYIKEVKKNKELLNSASWKVTTPLRRISSRLRRKK